MSLDDPGILRRADERPDDASAQIAAAYACDRAGDEARAATYYDAAWRLGLPSDIDRVGFMLGYGSTLKNVGRLEESEAVLRQALTLAPDHRALRLFLALTLEKKGRSAEALAEAIDVVLTQTPHTPDIQRFARALSEYVADLRQRPS